MDSISPRYSMAQASNGSESHWMNEFLTSRTVADKQSAGPQHYSSGNIDNIDIPDGWTKGKHSQFAGNRYDEYVPKGASDNSCRLQFYERGTKLREEDADNFKKILSQPDHQLSKDEIKSLGSVLDNKQLETDFRVDRSWTATLNGQRVLMVEGEFLEDQRKNLSMITAADGGSRTQEVSYMAPADKYALKKDDAIKSLKTISWK